MERYQIILCYDGTDFVGSQRQAARRTVQGEIEKALRQLNWTGKSILLAGRTDTGTHASGQAASFDLEWGHGLDALQRALNAHLASDIAVTRVKRVAENFHPRFDATSRRYQYCLFCQPVRDPLRERFAWRVWPPVPDLASLQSIWLGRHDYSAFGTPPRTGGSTTRTVTKSEWTSRGDEWVFDIQADAFLYRMIRRLVFVQVAVCQGRSSIETLARHLQQGRNPALEHGSVKIPTGLAPASGLVLVEVRYDNLVD